MTDAKYDNNRIPTLLGISSADGITPLRLQVDPTTHGIVCDDNTTGSNLSAANARRDTNGVPVMIGVSNADGSTPVMPYINGSNQLLTNSN